MNNDVQLAHALLRKGDIDSADRVCRLVLARDRKNVAALLILGMIEATRGNVEEAARNFEAATSADPRRADAHFNLGLIRLKQGQAGAALVSFDRALQLAPGNTGASLARAEALIELSKYHEALIVFDGIVAREPTNAKAWGRRGFVLYQTGEHDPAVESYRRAIQLSPRDPDLLNGVATALMALGRLAEAVNALSDAISQDKDFAAAYSNRAVANMKLQRFEESEADHRRALSLDALDARLLANYAEFLNRVGRNREAEEVLRKAIPLDPVAASILLGNVLADELRNEEALASYDRALALRPDEPFAHWCKGLLNLRLGKLKEGFDGFEWRNRGAIPTTRTFLPGVQWNPESSVRGGKLFLYAEHGLGDTIQFARFVPTLIDNGYDVVMEVQTPLVSLMNSLHPRLTVVRPGDVPMSDFDSHCALPSLPSKLETTLETIPSAPYLKSSKAASSKISQALSTHSLPRIGLCWAGSAMHDRDAKRSIPWSLLKSILGVEGVSFVSLQKEVPARDAEAYGACSSVIDLSADLVDFDVTASAIESLDLIISVDTSIAHLAGALGKPVWILLPLVPDWRWLLGRSDSPWYPSARLFRQHRAGDWPDVLEQVRGELQQMLATTRSEINSPR